MEEEKTPKPPPPWSCMPPDLLWVISRKTGDVADFVRFCAVCKDWRAAAWPTPDECGHIDMDLPWLVSPYTDLGILQIYTRANRKYCAQVPLPEARGKLLCGFSNEWLALFDPLTNHLSLLHPVTRAHIPLPTISWSPVPCPVQESEEELRNNLKDLLRNMEPPVLPPVVDFSRYGEQKRRLYEYTERYVNKVILSSSNPKGADAVVMVILGNWRRFAYCELAGGRRERRRWRIVDPHLPGWIIDVKYVDGLFEAISSLSSW